MLHSVMSMPTVRSFHAASGIFARSLLLAAGLGAAAPLPVAASDANPPDRLPAAQAPLPAARASKIGVASIYHDRLDGRTTASGEQYNRNALTAAHRSLPFGTLVRVTNVKNQRTVIVRINDRGPNVGNRLIDLTPRAAAAIGLHGISIGEVRVEPLGAGAVLANPSEMPGRAPLPVK